MISKMLTITRIYNSATAVGVIRRGIALARDYASRRVIGNDKLSNMPLQLRVLSNLEVIHRGNLVLYLKLSLLFSKEQYKSIKPHEANLLRVMVPLMKLFTGKQSLIVTT
jgi:alkylation response protein AidB-like acyl-CoA dehydrogenase